MIELPFAPKSIQMERDLKDLVTTADLMTLTVFHSLVTKGSVKMSPTIKLS
jgi:hypothetical protein